MAAGFFDLGAMAWGWKSSAKIRVLGPYRVARTEIFAPGATESQIKGLGAIQREVRAASVGTAQEVV